MYPPYGLPHGGVILHGGFLGALLCAALGKPSRLFRKPLRESPRGLAVVSRSFTRVTALVRERPGRPVIGDVLFHGLALTKQALDNSLSETGIAIWFPESVYLFRSPGTCYSGPSESVKQSVHRFR
jgi:hypothetical protein